MLEHDLFRPAFARRSAKPNGEPCHGLRAGGKPVPTPHQVRGRLFRDHALMHAPSFWWQEPGTVAALLAPVAAVYGAVAAARLRQTGELAGVPVLCVGNPTVG